MQPRSTAILAVVVAICAALVYFYEIEGAGDRESAEAAGKRVFADLEAEAVVAVGLTTADGLSARAERRDGRWQIVSPVDFPGDGVALDAITSALAQLDPEVSLDEPQPLSVYGLGDGARRVEFEAGTGQQTLLIGNDAPVGANTYVAAGGDTRVHTVPTWRVNAFDKTLDDLRDRRVLAFDRTLVDRIILRWPGGGVELQQEETQWRLTHPLEGDADDDAVASLLSDLSFLRAEGFVDEVAPDPELGLDPAALEIELVMRSEPGVEASEARTLRFALGEERDGKRIARGEHSALFEVAAERLADFAREVVSYRFKQLSRFGPADARRLEYVIRGSDGDEIRGHGTRDPEDGTGWEMEPPLEAGRARSLVTALSHLEASDIAADWMGDAELEGFGFAPPRVELRVFGEKGEDGEPAVLAEVLLGVADVARGIAARRVGRDEIFLLDYGLAEDLPITPDAYRARFEAIAPIDVEEPAAEAAADVDAPAISESPTP